ncbi:MAG: hypothetical protein AAF211_17605, partial [Myxococcota bacterium]
MLGIVALLPAQALAGLFATADEDGDGIPDRRDGCLVLPETYNGYADADGCPDHLAVLDVLPMLGDTAVVALVELHRDDGPLVAEAPRIADDLVPGERVTVRASVSCFEGVRQFAVQQGHNLLEVRLRPRFDRETAWLVTGPEGEPVADVTLRFDSACAPARPQELPDGEGLVWVGN